jgi:dihydropteroate synthase
LNSSAINLFGLEIGINVPVRLMGVLNLSPESFYRGSIVQTYESTKARMLRFIDDGAEILDLGPKSTAPIDIYGQPNYISSKEEIERLKIPLEVYNDLNSKVLLSIDTQSSEVAEYGLSMGAHIINDISGFKDKKILDFIHSYNAGAVIMPAKEKPGDIFRVTEIKRSLQDSLKLAEMKGINPSKIILDPGIGGWVPERKPDDDYNILKQLEKIRIDSLPILVAISRKSFIGATLSAPPEERLHGSIAATAISVVNGANIIRTHDVRATKDAIRIAEKLR